MKITLIRHTSVDVLPGTCYGQSDVPLNDSFIEEADRVLSALAGMKFDRVFTSPLSRCVRLSDYCGYCDANRDPRLMEMDFGDWEMKRWEEITDPRLQEWFDDYLNVKATGGESFADQQDRVADFIADLCRKDYQEVAIFTHGGTILQFLIVLGYVSTDNMFEHQPPYGGILKIDVDTDTHNKHHGNHQSLRTDIYGDRPDHISS